MQSSVVRRRAFTLVEFSYTMNVFFSGERDDTPRVQSIKRSSDMIVFVEETVDSMNDGAFDPPDYFSTGVRDTTATAC